MIHFVKSALLWFLDSFRKPEWIAAYALSIQAVIFWWQSRILRRHATTLEEHTEIARNQSKTADLIGQALKQQGSILVDQTKIMSDQFNFQKLLEAQSERKIMFDLVVKLLASVRLLTVKIETMPFSPEEVARISESWIGMEADATACRKALVTCFI